MPVALDLGALLAAFLAFVVCYALLVAYKNTLGALLTVLASIVPDIHILGHDVFGWLKNGIIAIDSEINAVLAAAVINTEHAWQRILTYTGTLIHETLHGIDELAGTVERAFSHTIGIVIPSKAAEKTLPLWRNLAGIRKEIAHLAREGLHAANTVTHVITHDIPVITVKFPSITKVEVEKAAKAVPAAITGTLPRLGSLERDVTGIEKWIRAHTKDFTLGAITGLLVASIARELPWLRCVNNKNVGKHLCSWPVKALEDLLGGVLDYLVVSNLCVLLTEMDKLATNILPFIEQGTAAIDSLIKCQKSTVAAPITLTRTAVTAPWSNLPL